MANARMNKNRQAQSIKVSNDFLQLAATGGWSRKRLALLGVGWPPRAGWKKRVIGTLIPAQAAQQLLGISASLGADTAQAPAREAAQADTGASGEVVQIWTDGACQPNPGPGGWGWMAIDGDGVITEDFGGAPHTTNNRMELMAILLALQTLPDGCRALVMSDSEYAVKGLTVWRASWQRRNWLKGAPGEQVPMPNRDLWLLLEAQLQRLRVHCQWLRGHAGEAGNERADHLAARGLVGAMP